MEHGVKQVLLQDYSENSTQALELFIYQLTTRYFGELNQYQ